MISYSSVTAMAATAFLAASGSAAADMIPAAVYATGAVDLLPAGFSTAVWAVVILPTACCTTALLWLIRSDWRKARGRPAKPVRPAPAVTGGSLQLSS